MVNPDKLMMVYNAATPGPWKTTKDYIDYGDRKLRMKFIKDLYNNLAYMCVVFNNVPEIVARIRELESQRDWLAGQAAKLKNKLWTHEKGFFDMPRTATKEQWRFFAEEYVKGNLGWGDDDDEGAMRKYPEIDMEWLMRRFTEVK